MDRPEAPFRSGYPLIDELSSPVRGPPAVTSTRCTSLCLQRLTLTDRVYGQGTLAVEMFVHGSFRTGRDRTGNRALTGTVCPSVSSVHNECVCVPQRWMDHCLEGVQLILFQGLGLFTNRKGRTTDLMGDNESVIPTVDM